MFKGNAESVSTGFGKSLKKDGPNLGEQPDDAE